MTSLQGMLVCHSPCESVTNKTKWKTNSEGKFTMPVMGPSENPVEVDRAYKEIKALLNTKYGIQKHPPCDSPVKWAKDRSVRNAKLRESIRLLFQLEAWESF